MLTENVLIQALIVVGSVVTTFLTVKYKDRIMGKEKKGDEEQDKEPRTRMDTIFDGYEKLIQQQQEDILRKEIQLTKTESLIGRLQKELNETKALVQRQIVELEEQKRLNGELVKQLEIMKTEVRRANPNASV